MPKDEIIVLFGLMIGIFSRVLPSIYKLSSSYINLNYYKPALDLMSMKLISKIIMMTSQRFLTI